MVTVVDLEHLDSRNHVCMCIFVFRSLFYLSISTGKKTMVTNLIGKYSFDLLLDFGHNKKKYIILDTNL